MQIESQDDALAVRRAGGTAKTSVSGGEVRCLARHDPSCAGHLWKVCALLVIGRHSFDSGGWVFLPPSLPPHCCRLLCARHCFSSSTRQTMFRAR